MELNWTKDKPTSPGAYWVRGFNVGEKQQTPALVEVKLVGDELRCNLGENNQDPFNDGPSAWSWLDDLSARFEWCGPLMPPNL